MAPNSAFESAFAQRTDILKRIRQTLGTFCSRADYHANSQLCTVKAPDLDGLFADIAHYIIDNQITESKGAAVSHEEPSSKKRKLERSAIESAGWDKGTSCGVADVSFSIPQRKKYQLQVGQASGIWASSSSGSDASVEFGVKWDRVQDIFCLPVPEKAQAQYNFCVFSTDAAGTAADQLLWTVPGTIPKVEAITGGTLQQDDTYKSFLMSAINKALKPHKKRVIEPTKDEFASQTAQAHRKGETAFHVKAFRGSKDGFLFLLSTGILWGFKKPLEFFPFDVIESISYTSILQRTFNMNIAFRSSNQDNIQEFEFSMIDQADFGGIDDYVKRHRLQDASMAEQRRAKKLNVNGVKGNEASQGGEEQEEGDLEKARREAEDLEDEEEEDQNFDPGSEGESEGSGSDSEDDGEDRDDEAEGNSGDEELGSEADDPEESFAASKSQSSAYGAS